MTLANAHALFNGLKADPSFLANLTISDDERKRLLEARQEVRTALKAAASRIPVDDTYWQPGYTRKVAARERPQIQIRFMTQGSFAYGTLNAPAQKPAQEIDLDDGMYVPVDFLDSGEPSLAAKQLFRFAEDALEPLCKDKGWNLDTSKDCCVRVKLWPGAHIDLPIYSIPRDRFVQLRENMERTATAKMALDSVKGAWKLPSDKIMLAHRDGSWRQSDPQQLHEWVEERIERYGPIYRRLSRFFKGWRDFTWEKTSLSSLCLMCAIDEALKRIDGFPTDNRDDAITMEVSKLLPEILGSKINNPVIRHLCLNEWEDADRTKIVDAARALRDEMTAALERTGDAEQVVVKLQKRFGARIPYRPDVVKIASKIAAIQQAPAAKVAAPRVSASTSG